MGLFFAPIANVVLSAVRPEEEGKASGANNAIRELGGVFGVAVLASVFSANGSYATGQTFVDGLVPAMQVGAVVVAFGGRRGAGARRSSARRHDRDRRPCVPRRARGGSRLAPEALWPTIRARIGLADPGSFLSRKGGLQPKVKQYASTPASRNSISKVRSPIGPGWRMSWYVRCSVDRAVAVGVDVGSRGAGGRLGRPG